VQGTNSYLNLAAGILPTARVPLIQGEMLTNGDAWADDGMGNSRHPALAFPKRQTPQVKRRRRSAAGALTTLFSLPSKSLMIRLIVF